MNNRSARVLFAAACLLSLPGRSLAASLPISTGAIAVVTGAPAGSTSPAVAGSIGKLEQRLFELTYPSEDDDARLTRVEKFVFGGRQTGSVQARLTRLESAISSTPTTATPPATPQKSVATANNSNGNGQSQGSQGDDAVTSSSSFASGNYPRVTELEQDMLGTTYAQEALSQRLSRLETKAFGAPSTSNDLCARVDSLDQYADRHHIFKDRHDPLVNTEMAGTAPTMFNRSTNGSGGGFGGFGGFAPPMSMMNDNSSDTSDDTPKPPVNPFIDGNVTGTDQRLSAIEEFTYGHNYATRPVQDRLARLEKRLVPYEHNLTAKDVPTRVNNLWSILSVANTLKNSPTAAHQGNMLASNVPSMGPSTFSGNGANQSSGGPPPQIFNKANSAPHSWLHQMGKTMGSSSTDGYVAPGAFPPGMAPNVQ
jgi:hypothetical protein